MKRNETESRTWESKQHKGKTRSQGRQEVKRIVKSSYSHGLHCPTIAGARGFDDGRREKEGLQSREVLLELLQPPTSSSIQYQDGAKRAFCPSGQVTKCTLCCGCSNSHIAHNVIESTLRKKMNDEWIDNCKGNKVQSERMQREEKLPPIPSSQKCTMLGQIHIRHREPSVKVEVTVNDKAFPSGTGKSSIIRETLQYPCCLPGTNPFPPDEENYRAISVECFPEKSQQCSTRGQPMSHDEHAARFSDDAEFQQQRIRTSGQEVIKEITDFGNRRTTPPSHHCHGCGHRIRGRSSHIELTAMIGGTNTVDNCQMEHSLKKVESPQLEEEMFLHEQNQLDNRHYHQVSPNDLQDQSPENPASTSLGSSNNFQDRGSSLARRNANEPRQEIAFGSNNLGPELPRHRRNDEHPPGITQERTFNFTLGQTSNEECTPVIVKCYSLSTVGSTEDSMVPHKTECVPPLSDIKRSLDPRRTATHGHQIHQLHSTETGSYPGHHRYNNELHYHFGQINRNVSHLPKSDIQSQNTMKQARDPEFVGERVPDHYYATVTQNRRNYDVRNVCTCGNCPKSPAQCGVPNNGFPEKPIRVIRYGSDLNGKSWHQTIHQSPPRSEEHGDLSHIQGNYQRTYNHHREANDVERCGDINKRPYPPQDLPTLKVHDYYEERRIFVEKRYQEVGNSAVCERSRMVAPSSYTNGWLFRQGNQSSRPNTSSGPYQTVTCNERSLDLYVHQYEAAIGSRKRKSRQPRPQRGKPNVIVDDLHPQKNAIPNEASNETANHHRSSDYRYETLRPSPENVHPSNPIEPRQPNSIRRRSVPLQDGSMRTDPHSGNGVWGPSFLSKRSSSPQKEEQPEDKFSRSALDAPTFWDTGKNKNLPTGSRNQNQSHLTIQDKASYPSWYRRHLNEPWDSHEHYQSRSRRRSKLAVKDHEWNGMLLKNAFCMRSQSPYRDVFKRGGPMFNSSRRHHQVCPSTSLADSDDPRHRSLFQGDHIFRPTVDDAVHSHRVQHEESGPEFPLSQTKDPLLGSDRFRRKTTSPDEVKKKNTSFPDQVDMSTVAPYKDMDGGNSSSVSVESSRSANSVGETEIEDQYSCKSFTPSSQQFVAESPSPIVKERRFVCRYCSKKFAHFSTLQNHLRTHTGDKPFQCKFCNRRFAQSGVLKAHLRTHTGDKPFSCMFCGKMFAQSTTLTNHLRTHTGQKPYTCQFCAKSFSQPSTLRKHELSHTKERPYPCTFCGKAFAQQSTLTNHLRSHTGQRPYKCHFCDKCFAQLSTLDRHLHLHTSVSHKPHQCQYCGKSFSYLSNLASHVKLHEQVQY